MKEYRPARIAPSDKGKAVKRFQRPMPRRPIRQNKSSTGKLILLVALACALGIVLQREWIQRNREKFGSPLMSRLFKQSYDSERIAIQCGHCGGTGLITSPAGGTQVMCPICYGVGTHHVRRVEKTDVLCAECLGAGRVLDADGHASACPSCGGSGVLRGSDTRGADGQIIRILNIECDECIGSGMVKDPETGGHMLCPLCFGRGYHWARKFHDSEVLCPACGGIGRVRDADTGIARICERCEGRGLIASPAQP